jgi:hypothetical protein
MDMPLFRLELMRCNEPLLESGEPQEFPDLAAARGEAIEALREVVAEAIRAGKPFNRQINILGAAGESLGVVMGAEAVPQLKSE